MKNGEVVWKPYNCIGTIKIMFYWEKNETIVIMKA